MGIEQERFINAQARLFQETGTRTQSHFLKIKDPHALIQQAHVLEIGNEAASPLVMIHGGNSVAAGFEPLLSLLQENFHIYAPDRPGCGLTDKLDYHSVHFKEHAIAFIGSVLDELKLDRVSLAGNSMGGYWIFLYALAHPERVKSLILLGEPAGSSPSPDFPHRLLATPGINRLLYATRLKPDRSRTRSQLSALITHPESPSEAFIDLVYAASVLPGATLAWLSMVEQFLPIGHHSEGTYALRSQLPKITCPTLFLWGDHDFCPPKWGQELCDLIPKAHIEIIPGAGHLVWVDAPEQVAQLIISNT